MGCQADVGACRGRLLPAQPALVQLGDERLRAAEHARAHAHLLQEGEQALVLRGVVVRQDLAEIARVRQALALGHAQEQARQPVGKVAADQQQVAVLELVEQLFGREVLGLQRADELEHVLVGDDVGRRGRELAEHVVNDRTLQLAALGREVGHAVRRVRDDFRVRLATEPFKVHRLLEQRVERRRDEQVEVRDLRQLAQRHGRRNRHLAHDRAQARVSLLAAAALPEIAADDIVERERLGEPGRVHRQLGRQLLGQPFVEQPRTLVGVDAQEVRPDDGNDPALLDVIEEVVPRVLIEATQVVAVASQCGRTHQRTCPGSLPLAVIPRPPAFHFERSLTGKPRERVSAAGTPRGVSSRAGWAGTPA